MEMEKNKTQDKNAVVNQLSSFYRGELSAVESYDLALKAEPFSPYRSTLEKVKRSHADRVRAIEEKIRALGGSVPESSGAWGALTGALESVASKMGINQAVAVLEQGEDHGVADYARDIDKLDGTVQAFVRDRLIPEQTRTHSDISALKKQLS